MNFSMYDITKPGKVSRISRKHRSTCAFCGTSNLEWYKYSDNRWLLRDKSSHKKHLCLTGKE